MIKRYLLNHLLIVVSIPLLLLGSTVMGQGSELVIDISSHEVSKSAASSTFSTMHKQLGRFESLKVIKEDRSKGYFSLEPMPIESFHPRIKLLSNPSGQKIFYSKIQELYSVKDNRDRMIGVFIQYPQSVEGEIEIEGVGYSIKYSKDRTYINKQNIEKKRLIPSMNNCSVKGDVKEAIAIKNVGYKKNNETKVLEIGIVMDNSCVIDAGGVENAIDRALIALSLSRSDYESIYENILFKVDEVVVSDCSSCDPWLNTTNVALLHHDVIEWAQNVNTLTENDLNIFWTGRDFDNNVLGSAHLGSICSDQNIALVTDLTSIPWKMRVVLSHEIGHVLGAAHDEAPDNIMSEVINNTHSWSPTSANNILHNLTGSTCIDSEQSTQCDWSGNVSVTWSSVDVLTINCAIEGVDSIGLVIRNQDSGFKEVVRNITNEVTSISNELINCNDYVFEFKPYCDSNEGRIVELIWGSNVDPQIEVLDVYILECKTDANGMPSYDLGLNIANQAGPINYSIYYKGDRRDFIIYSGINNYVFPNYRNEALLDQPLNLFYESNKEWYCSFSYGLDEPSLDCAFRIEEDFNSCGLLPLGWEVTKSENTHELFQWSSKGSERAIINYGNASNSLTSKTINGTCMMIIDDDLINLPNHSGSTILTSPFFDIGNISHLHVAFDLIFDRFTLKGNNSSFLSFEANLGNGWIELAKEESGQCIWSNIWASGCSSEIGIDLSHYEGDSIQFRWIYDDGGSGHWTGMAALDNFRLTGSKITLGPCDIDDVHIIEAPQESIVQYGKMIHVNATINIPEVQLDVIEGAIFYPGTSISHGTSLFVEVKQCETE